MFLIDNSTDKIKILAANPKTASKLTTLRTLPNGVAKSAQAAVTRQFPELINKPVNSMMKACHLNGIEEWHKAVERFQQEYGTILCRLS